MVIIAGYHFDGLFDTYRNAILTYIAQYQELYWHTYTYKVPIIGIGIL